ncbi:Uridine kinase-like protein 1, chloroplastic [Vitis vinifera]|uniref:uracil phosphoribosyltransferase n=1 Tax=Vitis vinifera TaxID=29760 RepID=A0A438H7B1_VITVI|nr:Uridine kinase-like protein 1, chloroplastic [Vitis vinifera]
MLIMQYAKFVKPAFDDFVMPSKKYADVIIPRGGDNHVAIDLIVQHIHTKLGQHNLCKIYPNVNVIQSTFQVCLSSVVEHGLGHLPFTEKQVVTPTGAMRQPQVTGIRRERGLERERSRERGESGGDEGSTEIAEGASHARPGKYVKRVDSAWNRKDSRSRWWKRRGRLHATIVERKGGISSWVRLGPVSLGIVFECLNLSIEDRRMGRWAREWKENGRMYSLSHDYNRGGCFLRLGVADLEGKRFRVFIPRGRVERGGWASMANTLRSLGCAESCPNNQKADVSRTKPNMGSLMWRRPKWQRKRREQQHRVDVSTEEVGRNLSKLGHCIVGTWNHNAAKGDDLRGWGSQLARIWRLKGNLGLAKMERGKVLMEFEIPAEAEQASKMGSILLGGVDLRLEKWNPETGCLKEGERSNEAWVRGSRAACIPVGTGYFEEDWGRRNGGSPPSLVEVWIDGFCYAVTLWWEIRPVIKVPATGKRGKTVVTVAKEGVTRRPVGRVRTRIQLGAKTGLQSGPMHRVGWVCWAKHHLLEGLKLTFPLGQVRLGWCFYGNGNGKPKEKAGPVGLLKGDGLAFRSSSPPVSSKAQMEKGSSAMERIRGTLRSPDVGISNCWGKDDQWGLRRGDETQWGGSPEPIVLCWRKTQGVFRPFWSFSGVNQGGLSMQGNWAFTAVCGKCWDLVEIRWEESDLARFSQFLGFSTEGLEKDILEFMVKIRKRRERVHSKAMLEKSKFERELRRLECSVNYEGGKKRKGNENSSMNEGMVRSLGSGRFLDWGALDAQGAAGGILICWDKRTLEILEMEMGQFTISCRLRNVEDGKTWIFTGVYGPFSKDDRDTFWGELGAIRGIWMTLGSVCRVEVNKNLALQQVEFWDRVESDRSLSERESELKTEAKEAFKNWAAAQSLNHAEAEGLEQPFTEAENHLALMGMNGDKAPGPDGFTVAFWQFCWEFVKEEIVDVFKEFYEDKSFAKSLNSTFLVLIPKKGGLRIWGISDQSACLGCVYKLLAKVLANKIKKVLDKVVSPDQNAFVKGRQILDASLIANEVIDYWLKRKEKGVICKLDIEKAYDSINWNFLMKVMRKMAFGDWWVEVDLVVLFPTASFSILVNGVPAGYFSNSRGLRQGCKVGTLPSVYLGLPLGAKHKAMAMWDGVEARMRRRLALWKRQYLSKGGRITLIKSTLASMPIYQLSLFRMPKLVVKRLEKLSKGLSLGRGSLERKIHLINWAGGVYPKGEWGLGIRKIDLLNKALLGKWIWRFAIEEDLFWRKVVEESSWCWDNIEFKVGKGTKVSFWTDHWCGNEELAQTFPQLFELAVQRNASVNEMWGFEPRPRSWARVYMGEESSSLIGFWNGSPLLKGCSGSLYTGVDFCKKLCGVSIVRSGESMENALRACCKGIKIGKILIHRDGDNGKQLIYEKLPKDISERHVLLLDPVLATGNSAGQAIELLIQKGVPESHIIFLNLISAPEGIHCVCKRFPSLKIVTSEIDVALNEEFRVIPGMGEFGDRYFGTDD